MDSYTYRNHSRFLPTTISWMPSYWVSSWTHTSHTQPTVSMLSCILRTTTPIYRIITLSKHLGKNPSWTLLKPWPVTSRSPSSYATSSDRVSGHSQWQGGVCSEATSEPILCLSYSTKWVMPCHSSLSSPRLPRIRPISTTQILLINMADSFVRFSISSQLPLNPLLNSLLLMDPTLPLM